jgi:hypothetical protein
MLKDYRSVSKGRSQLLAIQLLVKFVFDHVTLKPKKYLTSELSDTREIRPSSCFQDSFAFIERIKTICFLKIHNIHFKSKKYV